MRKLGLDLGTKSCGIAISDKTNFLASPLENFRFSENDFQKAALHIKSLVEQYQDIDKIVLGYPKNMDNTVGKRGIMTERFKLLLEKHIDSVEVILLDERLTTKISHSLLLDSGFDGKKRKKIKDQTAATIILQNFLDTNKKI